MENVKRDGFTSKLGVIAATLGSAIGLGNIWKFPSLTGSNGGATFLLIYLISTLLVGLPVMIGETMIGRKARADAITTLKKLSPAKQPWWLVGAAGVAARLTIDAAHPSHAVSPMLYGIFFEDINCSADGGLYAELVRTRNFEDSGQPVHWLAVSPGSRRVELSVDSSQPLSPRNPRSLKVAIAKSGSGRAGVANDGFWGISVVSTVIVAPSPSSKTCSGSVFVTCTSCNDKYSFNTRDEKDASRLPLHKT